MSQTMSRTIRKDSLYDYSDSFRREQTAAFLLDYAKRSKDDISSYWNKMKSYYDGNHAINTHTGGFYEEHDLPWRAAQSTDGYIHVETQIDPDVPDFEFAAREDSDTQKARQRESIVKYIIDNNDLEYKNSRNERTLGIYGSAVWKVCWDGAKKGGFDGDVCIEAPRPEQIFTDPTATDIDGCEYIGYVYKMHRQKALRVFKDDLAMRGMSFEECAENLSASYTMASSIDSVSYDREDDTVTVTEWWFRQPKSGKCTQRVFSGGRAKDISYSWKAGDIALCVFVNGREVRYVPKYWASTSFSMFPFVVYNRIPADKSIWGKSELELLIPLIDAKDRELAFAQLNLAYSSNDIIVAEENAFSDGEIPDNSPGAIWKLRPGMMGKVQRLGNNAGYSSTLYNGCSYWKSLMEDTTGNFEISQGKEPTSVTTATGIALLNERSQVRKNLKNIDRTAGFKRLFMLIDATALEYYDDGRIIKIGAAKDNIVFKYTDYAKSEKDGLKSYIPVLDVVIHAGNSASESKALTISALNTLMSMNITKDNYVLAKAYVDVLNIPQRAQINKFLDDRFSGTEDEGADKEYEASGKEHENKKAQSYSLTEEI